MSYSFIKGTAITALSVLLLVGCSGTVVEDSEPAKVQVETGFSKVASAANPASVSHSVGMVPFTKQDHKSGWKLTGKNDPDPYASWQIPVGYANIKLYAKNTGKGAYRVEVQHENKKTVIFNATVASGTTQIFVNNDNGPQVPSGDYIITIYSGRNMPKGTIVLEDSEHDL